MPEPGHQSRRRSCLATGGILLGVVLLLVIGLVCFIIMQESPRRRNLIFLENELKGEYLLLSLTQTTEEFLSYIEHNYPQEEKACLLHSRIGAPGTMRCRSWPTGRNRRLYIFYTFDQTAARDRQSFIVFGVYENKVYFSKYTNPEWQNRVKDVKEFQAEPQMRPPWKNRMENAP